MNRSIHSKFLAFLLALVMVFSMLPVSALAAEETVTYTKVTKALDDWTGEYLLVYEEQGFALNGSLETVDAVNNYVKVTITDNAIQTKDHSIAVFAERVEGGYVLKTASGQYIYHSSDANKISTTTNQATAAKYPITFKVTDEGIDIALSSKPHMRFNAASDQMRFRYFKSTSYTNQKAVTLYKLESSTEPEKETVAKPTASPAPGAVAAGTEVTFSCATEGAVIQYHTGDSNWITASKAVVNAATTFTVKATKDGMNDSAEATFAYTIQTEEASIVSISKALAGEEGTSFTVKGVVTCVDGQNIYVQDSTGGICVRMSAKPTDISLGDTIIGTGSKTAYRGMAQLGDGTYEKSSGLTLTAKETTIGELTTADVCTYVKLINLEITKIDDNNGAYSNPNVTFKDEKGETIQLYKAVMGKNEAGTWEYAVGDLVDVTAAVGINNTDLQLRNTLTSEITKAADAPSYNTIAEALAGEEGASFTVKGVVTLVDGKNIYIQDETGGIDLYFGTAPTDIALGDTIIGTGVRTTYNGLPELKDATYEKSSGLTLTAKETTIGALTDKDICTYISLKGVEVTEVYDNNGKYSNPNITVTDGTNTIQLYKAVVGKTDGAWDFKVGDKIDIKAAVSVYNSKLQLRNTLASEVTLTPKTQYAKLTDAIETDDQFVIYYNKDSLVMTETVNGKGLDGTAATPVGEFVAVTEDMAVLTAVKDENGSYTFTTADGKYLTSGATGNSLTLADEASDYSLWTLKPVTGGFHIVNVNAVYKDNKQALEIYNGVFTTFSEKDTDYYLFNLYKLTDEEPTEDASDLPADGDQVVIYNASAEGVIGLEDSLGATMSSVAAVIEDGKAIVGNGGRVFTVSVSGSDYSFASGGKYLAADDAENLFLTETLDDYAKWNLEKKTDGYVMNNKAAKYTFSNGGSATVCIEYFSGSFSGWTYKSADSAIFEFNFYPVAEGTPITDGVVNKPAVDFGTLTDAFIHTDYTFSFNVDAVFGVEGELTVKVGETELTANEDGSYTIPAELVAGESLTITVSGVDTKGVDITGSAVVTVLDVPVIDEVTPASGEQTGDNKKPDISAKISNAGENPTVTMTVNGEEVAAVYDAETGLVSYTPAEDMADGRTTVTVTVVRADEKEASKSWSFVVGKSRYQLYFGQLHSHTTFSDGSGSLDSALDYVANLPDSANVDFVAFTDHSNYFDTKDAVNPESALYDMTQATAYSQETWAKYKNTVAAFNESQAKIVAVAGFEMTWSGGPGHINTFNTPGIVSRNNSTLNNKTDDAGLKAYYALLSQPEGAESLSQLNHPGSTFGTFADFAYWDPVIDSRVFLVEVGNGEGAIGAGGYYPSYEYYTMALDKGWHVAPTNNQDNHKGKWGNANDARDVVLTDDFTEAGIYQAIRDMRVYATEDKNLEITYTLNGYQLGSSIDVPEKVNIEVTVNDPDSNDSISKVEVVVNSGKVIHTWNDPAQLATGALSVELDPDYSYYYIRVTEGDGDLAVTAPVWVGESLKLGISSLECGTATPVTNEELKLTTTLFNSEAMDATVKSITYTTNGSEVLGTDETSYTVPASGTLAVEFAYTPTVAKVMTITATVVLEQDSKEYTFTKDIELDILDASALVYIGIDASHHNEYVAGNYKDSMGNFGALAAEYSVRTVQLNTSADLIAACGNEKYKAIVLTAPSRRDGTALRNPYDTYSDAEVKALVAFNNAGGTVILCGWGDYYESYSEFPAEDHMAAQQNKILSALGSSIRVSDDETRDDSWNGGQAQRLYLSSYNFDSFLLEGVEYDAENPHNNIYTELYSQYGGASIYVVDGNGDPTTTVPGTVTPVVYGFDTTYSSDDDNDNYGGLASVPKYTFDGADRLMVMASEQLEGKGLIVVSGAAFLSNFEVQATVSDNGSEKNYSNYKICENLLQVLNPVTVTAISEVRAQTEVGYKYTIEGVVTSNASGYDKDTAFFDCIYVQDATGGICCFPVAGEFKIGDVVRVTGTTDFFQGEPELQVTGIQKIGETDPVVPTTVSAAQINDRSAEGKLVTVSGTVESFELANGLVQTIMVKDSEGNVARVFIDGYITTAKDVENLAVGNEITATGLASYDDTFNAPEGPFPRIRIRNRADVVCTIAKHDCDLEGHGWDEGKVTKEPTCTEEGEKTYTCQYCGKTKTEQIGALGHDWDEGQVTKEPTCTEAGEKTYTCQRCQDTYTEEIPALGHSYVDGTCERCGEKDPDSVPTTPVKPIWKSWLDRLLEKLHDIISKPTDPVKPPKPHWGGIFDWIPGLWK